MKPTIDELLTRYDNGETTVAEERQLRDYFRNATHVAGHQQPYAALFGYVADAQTQQPAADFAAGLERRLQPKPAWTVQRMANWGVKQSLQLAAGVLLLLLGFAAGRYYNRSESGALSAGTLLVSGPTPADSIKRVLAFDARAETSASDRIQAVNQSVDLDGTDREITQLLINTLNFDANVNVRLAACQALLRFEGEEGVREALIQSLRIQKDPNVQLTLIESLVAIKEKRATREMQWMARNGQVLEIVRLKAEEGVGALTKTTQSPS